MFRFFLKLFGALAVGSWLSGYLFRTAWRRTKPRLLMTPRERQVADTRSAVQLEGENLRLKRENLRLQRKQRQLGQMADALDGDLEAEINEEVADLDARVRRRHKALTRRLRHGESNTDAPRAPKKRTM